MATQSSTTAVSHSSTANFRIWGGELSGMLTSAGLPKSGDTGQANWTTANRPAANGSVYEIRYLNDSLHATNPLYFKIEYGTNDSAGNPCIWVTCGSSTNGAGTITGTTYFSRVKLFADAACGGGTYFTGVCVRSGYFAMVWKRGAMTDVTPFFAVCRSCDDSGDPTATGAVFYYSENNTGYRYTYTTASNLDYFGYCLFPGGLSVTLVDGSPQVMRHWMAQPQIRCVPFMVSFIDGEIGDMSTFTATPVGATSRTYLALGGTKGPTYCGMGASSSLISARFAMQWE